MRAMRFRATFAALRTLSNCRVGEGDGRASKLIFGHNGAVPTFGGDQSCNADVGTAP